ncbi:hypothetical protein EDD16DRAFT_1699571 [Pisolithus croceorrhizus]|nr:hypothetical protein EDD16DRAFT_1699571 [Pisolithus croceorrhizus]
MSQLHSILNPSESSPSVSATSAQIPDQVMPNANHLTAEQLDYFVGLSAGEGLHFDVSLHAPPAPQRIMPTHAYSSYGGPNIHPCCNLESPSPSTTPGPGNPAGSLLSSPCAPTPPPTNAVQMTTCFTEHELIAITHAVVELLHRKNEGVAHSLVSIRQKMVGILSYQSIANILSSSEKVTIAALVDWASELQWQGSLLSDKEKGKVQAKAEEACVAGEEICMKSMQTLGHHQRLEDDSDKENVDPVKKKCCICHSTSSNEDLKTVIHLMGEDMSHWHVQSKEIVSQMQQTTKVFEKTSECYLEILAQPVKH